MLWYEIFKNKENGRKRQKGFKEMNWYKKAQTQEELKNNIKLMEAQLASMKSKVVIEKEPEENQGCTFWKTGGLRSISYRNQRH